MNEVNAEPPSTWYSKHIPQISKLYPYSLQSYWTSKFSKIIPYAIFAQKRTLQCVTKIILTAKLFGIGSSNFGFVHLDNWATHSKNLNKIRRRSAWGFLKICSFDVEWPCIIINISKSYVLCAMLDMSLLLVFFHAGNKLWTADIYLVAQNKKTQKLKTKLNLPCRR